MVTAHFFSDNVTPFPQESNVPGGKQTMEGIVFGSWVIGSQRSIVVDSLADNKPYEGYWGFYSGDVRIRPPEERQKIFYSHTMAALLKRLDGK